MGGGRAVEQRHTVHRALRTTIPATEPEAVRLGRQGSVRARARGAALALGRVPPCAQRGAHPAAGRRRLTVFNACMLGAALPSRGVASAA